MLPPPFQALRVAAERAALLIVDVQERLCAAMDTQALAAAQRNWLTLIELARRLRMPIVVSEQYPRGLGPTIGSLSQALEGASVSRFEKLEFGCTDNPDFQRLVNELGREQWIVAGMETHVCVWQTVRGLRSGGRDVHVPGDAVLSRTSANHAVGLRLMERADAVVTSTEAVVFDALKRAATEDFKALSRLIK